MSSILTVGTGIALMGSPGLRTLAEDFFTDADSTLLSAHVPTSGGSWALHASYSGAGDSAVINSNRVHNANDTNRRVYVHSAVVPANCEVEADFWRVTDNAASEAALALRIQSGADTYYFAWYSANPNGWRLFKVVAGAQTALIANSNVGLASDGTVARAKFTAQGSLLRLFVDGALVHEVTDTAISGAGAAGIMLDDEATSTTGIHLDNFLVRG